MEKLYLPEGQAGEVTEKHFVLIIRNLKSDHVGAQGILWHVHLFFKVPMEKLYLPEGQAGEVTEKHGDLIGTSAYVPDMSDEAFAFDRTVSRLVR